MVKGQDLDLEEKDLVDKFVTCQVCGEEFKALNSHLKFTHNMTTDQYREEFPEAPIWSEKTRQDLSRSMQALRSPQVRIYPNQNPFLARKLRKAKKVEPPKLREIKKVEPKLRKVETDSGFHLHENKEILLIVHYLFQEKSERIWFLELRKTNIQIVKLVCSQADRQRCQIIIPLEEMPLKWKEKKMLIQFGFKRKKDEMVRDPT